MKVCFSDSCSLAFKAIADIDGLFVKVVDDDELSLRSRDEDYRLEVDAEDELDVDDMLSLNDSTTDEADF